jgi:hypothetical protein
MVNKNSNWKISMPSNINYNFTVHVYKTTQSLITSFERAYVAPAPKRLFTIVIINGGAASGVKDLHFSTNASTPDF